MTLHDLTRKMIEQKKREIKTPVDDVLADKCGWESGYDYSLMPDNMGGSEAGRARLCRLEMKMRISSHLSAAHPHLYEIWMVDAQNDPYPVLVYADGSCQFQTPGGDWEATTIDDPVIRNNVAVVNFLESL